MSFLLNGLSWLWDTLWSTLGLKGKEGSLLVLGLDNAGKTTLLYTLQTGGDVRAFPPTDRPALQKFRVHNIQFQAWDLGGHEAVRHMWQDYVLSGADASTSSNNSSNNNRKVSAVLFLMDAADEERLEEAGYELDALIGEEHLLEGIPVAVLLNKCDLETARSTEEIQQRIEWERLKEEQGGDEFLKMYRISVLKNEGYQAAFRWISSFLR